MSGNENEALKVVKENIEAVPKKNPFLEEDQLDEKEPAREEMPPEIAFLLEERLQENKMEKDDNIWPVIWDFAGQDVYRAIHPIFMSPDDIYLLVADITKNLSDKAECHLNRGNKEEIVPARDNEDTNLDHMMRWLDLIHSLKKCGEDEGSTGEFFLPPVIFVGTHATNPDPTTDADLIWKNCEGMPKELAGHIVSCLPIDNTKAGMTTDQEKIEDLREEILSLADKLPHAKKEIPLQWHRVEKEITKEARQGKKYLQKKAFYAEIVSKFCKLDNDDEFNELLYFLHARGSIVYHEHSSDDDGLVVLDPQWLINILCEIIKVTPSKKEPFLIRNDRKTLEDKGILSTRLLDHACRNQNLDPIKYSLLSLMEKFNLLCKWPTSRSGDSCFLVPCMLKTTAKEGNIEDKMSTCSAPVYLTFGTLGTNYVPSGLFCRLVLLFAKWLSVSQHTHEYRLYANEARFAIDAQQFLHLVCYKTVIKLCILSCPSKENSSTSNHFIEVLGWVIKLYQSRLVIAF